MTGASKEAVSDEKIGHQLYETRKTGSEESREVMRERLT